MAYKTILIVTGTDRGDRDLEIAAELCREIDAHLSVLTMALSEPPMVSEGAMDAYIWALERQPDAEQLKTRVAAVTDFLADHGVSVDISSEYPDSVWADEIVGRRARYADLVFVGPELLADGSMRSKVVEGTLFLSGRPVLLVPEASQPTLRPKRVLLAWDSSLEASRAAHESLDILTAADDVHVAFVDPMADDSGQRAEPDADFTAYLTRHGVKVSVDWLPSCDREIADVLTRHAKDISADLIVMGAYGHSRMREWILGGVTKSMLENPRLPILMAH